MLRLDIYVLVITVALILGFSFYSLDKKRKYTFSEMQQAVIKNALRKQNIDYDIDANYLLQIHIIDSKGGIK